MTDIISNACIRLTQVQRLYHLIYDDNVSEGDMCEQADPRADWPVDSSSGLFNIASVCLRVDPNQRPDMEEVSLKKQQMSLFSFLPGCYAVRASPTELTPTCIYWFIFIIQIYIDAR